MRLPARWRALLARMGRAPSLPEKATFDPFSLPEEGAPAEEDALSTLLAAIEATALAVYADHGLPTRPGHYVRGPRSRKWKFVAERLTPEERFELVRAKPPEHGLRFGRLADLGRRSETPQLIAASELLEGAALVRGLRASVTNADDLVSAIRLGDVWRLARDIRAVRSSSLRLARPTSGRGPRSKA